MNTKRGPVGARGKLMTDNPYQVSPPFRLSFSGGRTSGYMLRMVLDAWGGKMPEGGIVMFANTGKEAEATYKFVHDIGKNWGVDILWLEYTNPTPYVDYDKGRPLIGGHGFRRVTFDTADRSGRPFEEIIAAKALYRREAKDSPAVLPNKQQRWCSGELKTRTMDRAMNALGHDSWTSIVGIRADEAGRFKSLARADTQAVDHVAPLIDAGVELDDVMGFWSAQPFDLGLPHDPILGTYQGNCDFCFLKAAAKRKKLYQENPAAAEWWLAQEQKTGQSFYGPRSVSLAKIALGLIAENECGTSDEASCICTE